MKLADNPQKQSHRKVRSLSTSLTEMRAFDKRRNMSASEEEAAEPRRNRRAPLTKSDSLTRTIFNEGESANKEEFISEGIRKCYVNRETKRKAVFSPVIRCPKKASEEGCHSPTEQNSLDQGTSRIDCVTGVGSSVMFVAELGSYCNSWNSG